MPALFQHEVNAAHVDFFPVNWAVKEAKEIKGVYQVLRCERSLQGPGCIDGRGVLIMLRSTFNWYMKSSGFYCVLVLAESVGFWRLQKGFQKTTFVFWTRLGLVKKSPPTHQPFASRQLEECMSNCVLSMLSPSFGWECLSASHCSSWCSHPFTRA